MTAGPPPPPPIPPANRDNLRIPPFFLRGHLYLHAVAFGVIAAHMTAYPELYTPHTWRGLLIVVTWLPPRTWAALFALVAAAKLTGAALYPRFAVPAIIAGAVILIWWAVGLAVAAGPFVHTDPGMRATIIPSVLAGLCLAEHFVALWGVDGRRRWPNHQRGV